MNLYPSWIHRIPEMIEALKLHPGERVDRQTVENLFDLRKTAAFYLLRRLGAERCGKSLVSLPNTVQLASGCVTIKCRDMKTFCRADGFSRQGARHRLRSHATADRKHTARAR